MDAMQDGYESVLSLDVDTEPPQGQLELPQGPAMTPQSRGPSLSDFQKQLKAVLQTVGRSQAEKMLRELVKQQKQEGRVR